MTITLTEKAAEKTKEAIRESYPDAELVYLRLGVQGGGCAGYNYQLELDTNPLDIVFESHGVKYVTNQICLVYIDGTELDYVESLYGGGYKFNNPNAKNTCGCNQSFEY